MLIFFFKQVRLPHLVNRDCADPGGMERKCWLCHWGRMGPASGCVSL